VAQWVLDRQARPAHGAAFRAWAARVEAAAPGLRVDTCHTYEVACRWRYRCVNPGCRKEYGRHTNSIDVGKQVRGDLARSCHSAAQHVIDSCCRCRFCCISAPCDNLGRHRAGRESICAVVLFKIVSVSSLCARTPLVRAPALCVDDGFSLFRSFPRADQSRSASSESQVTSRHNQAKLTPSFLEAK
jgi:hypothetical protein